MISRKIIVFQEFIEKAKGIVSNHHDLQRNKATIETEVRQLELEQEKIIQTKEKEMIDHLLKQGMTVGDAKRRVKLTIENTINALQGIYSLNQTRSESGSNSIWIRIRFVLD